VDPRALLALLATVLVWSSTFAAIRAALRGISPPHLTLVRFAIASLVMAGIAAARGIRLPDRKDWPRITWLSLLGITLYQLLLNYSEQTVTAGTTALVISSETAMMALLSHFLLGERLSRRAWFGIVLAFVGVGFIVWGQGRQLGAQPIGIVLVLSAAFTTSLYFVLQKPLLKRYSAFDLTSYSTWIGTVPLFAFSGGLREAWHAASPATIWSVLYLALGPGAIGYICWAYGLSRTTAARAASFLYGLPVAGLLIAYLWLGEIPSGSSLFGAALTITGMILATRG
jgi:drug/metabolite transporter (DMT)-like permease